MRVAFYRHAADPVAACVDLSWEELASSLTEFDAPRCSASTCVGRDCPAKDVFAWSPVDLREPHRLSENVVAVTSCVIDLDHLTTAEFDDILSAVAGVLGVVHTTHSHAPDASPPDGSYRLVLAVSRPLLPAEWPALRREVVRKYGLQVDPGVPGVPGTARGADPQAKDVSRFYYMPTRRDGAPYFARVLNGSPLDVDALLVTVRRDVVPPPASPPVVSARPVTATSNKIAAVTARVAEVAALKSAGESHAERDHAELLRKVLAGEPLSARGARDATLLRVTGVLSHWLAPDTSWADVEAVLRPSVEAMDCTPEGPEHYLALARDKFRRQSAHRAASDEKRASDAAGLKEITSARRRPAKRRVDQSESLDDSTATTGTSSSDTFAAISSKTPISSVGDDWQDDLIVDGKGVRPCEHNACLLVANAPELRGTVRWDAVRRKVDVRSGPLVGLEEEVLPDKCAALLQKNYEFFAGAQLVGRALLCVALENQFDPIADALRSYVWDGVPRVDSFLQRYMGSPDTPYVRAVSRRWCVGLVARPLSPGCKLDTVLIVEGPQGRGKSSALEALAGGPEYFTDTHLEIGEKDGMQAIGGAWIVELGELASLRKAELDRVKQFVTSRVDKYRPPYGKAVITAPRRCVLVGSTNEGKYLRDPSGNRRYWPVPAPAPDVVAIRKDREQVLAEAVAMYKSGERWWFEGEEKDLAAAEAAEREEGSTIEEAVERWWFELQPGSRPRSASVLEIAEAALRMPLDRVDRRVRSEIGHAMSRMGFESKLRRRGDARVTVYEPTRSLVEAPRRARFNQTPLTGETDGSPRPWQARA